MVRVQVWGSLKPAISGEDSVEVEGETRPALTGELSWLCLLEEAASVAEPCGAVMAL